MKVRFLSVIAMSLILMQKSSYAGGVIEKKEYEDGWVIYETEDVYAAKQFRGIHDPGYFAIDHTTGKLLPQESAEIWWDALEVGYEEFLRQPWTF